MRSTGVALIAACLVSASALADVDLSRLTHCTEIKALWNDLRVGDPSFAQDCRQASGTIERAMYTRGGGRHSGQDICFLRRSPSDFLNDFQCSYTWNAADSAGILCIRQVPRGEIADYLNRHDSYFAPIVADYESRASQCMGGRTDTTTAPATVTPLPVVAISRYDFGFMLTSRSNSEGGAALHGYATLDPSLGGAGSQGIEFVSLFIAPDLQTPRKIVKDEKHVGNWGVAIDDAGTYRKAMEQQFLRQHVRVLLRMKSFDIRRTSGPYEEYAQKIARLESWEDAIASTLQHNDFEVMSDSDLRRHHAPSTAEMRQRWEGVIAYGYRDNSPVQLGNKIVVLVNTWSPNCVKRNGGFGAAVMATKPIPEVNASNGSITVMVYGIEGCARDQKETTDYADGVMEHVESDLLSQLGAQ